MGACKILFTATRVITCIHLTKNVPLVHYFLSIQGPWGIFWVVFVDCKIIGNALVISTNSEIKQCSPIIFTILLVYLHKNVHLTKKVVFAFNIKIRISTFLKYTISPPSTKDPRSLL